MYKQRGIRACWNADHAPSYWELASVSLHGADQVACLCLAASRVPPGTRADRNIYNPCVQHDKRHNTLSRNESAGLLSLGFIFSGFVIVEAAA